MTSRNQELFQLSQKYIPGGVNSPVRAFKSVGGVPIFFQRGQGAYVWDADNKAYIDYVCSWGPLILGHAHPQVIKAVEAAAKNGLTFGAPTEMELKIAELLCKLVPSIEQVRLVSSGTEATMSAIRLARGYTGRSRIIKFEGCYHGHDDSLLVKAGSGALTFGHPSSAGVPAETAAQTTVLDYNDFLGLEQTFDQIGGEIAAVIVEPVAGNMNLVVSKPGFLLALRDLCTKYGSILIFDEVMTGFRVGLGCAQELYGVKPDLTTLGKVIGGGMPMAAFGGRRDNFKLTWAYRKGERYCATRPGCQSHRRRSEPPPCADHRPYLGECRSDNLHLLSIIDSAGKNCSAINESSTLPRSLSARISTS